MTAEFEPFVQIAGLIHALTKFADNLGQTTQEWMEQLQEGLNERSCEFAAALAEHEREQAEAFRVLAQGGWVGMERHFTLSQARSVLEIGRTTRQIDRNTKQLREDSEAIRKTLASIAREPDAPLLSLTFSEPGKRWILPHARDKDRSLQFVL